MKILSWDLETSGLSPACEVTEIGCVLFDTESKALLRLHSAITEVSKECVFEPKAEALAGLSKEIVAQEGVPLASAFAPLYTMAEACDAYLGHNLWEADFQWLFQLEEAKKLPWKIPYRPVIDTMWDVPYPYKWEAPRILELLCARHRVFNPLPHRALFDAVATFQLANQYPWEILLENALQPEVWIVAVDVVQPWIDGGVSNKLAKDSGFHWKPAPIKQWRKKIKFRDLTQFQNQCELRVLPLSRDGKMVIEKRLWGSASQ
jgi:hypothetical protein